MKKILVACGAGVCTSTVALQKLKQQWNKEDCLIKYLMDNVQLPI